MTVTWQQNLPLFMIVGPLMGAALSSALRGKLARWVMLGLAALECAGMGILLAYTLRTQSYFTYAMGDIGAPFGNELRVGPAEALAGLLFALVVFFSIAGGWRRLDEDVAQNRRNLYAAVTCLLLAAMTAMTFTNDLFTAYVFIEISTIAACALIASSNRGNSLFASARYMVMNLLGSGLFLLGLSMLYALTGHLLFPQLGESVRALVESGRYPAPLYLSFLLMTLGVAVKSALYPFHTWLPGAYSSATPTSSAILSSVVSKMYIFLLMKLFLRAEGAAVFAQRIDDVLFLYAAAGVVLGSVHAVLQHRLLRMVAYSSVAQIGYIFLGLALGTAEGAAAALFHILAHSAAKAMLFLASGELRAACDGQDTFPALRGAAKKAPLAALAFLAGACSLVGVPVLGGFASKLFLAQAGMNMGGWRMAAVLAAIALSTVLNVAYFLRAVMTLYRDQERDEDIAPVRRQRPGFGFTLSMLCLMALNLGLGLGGGAVLDWIRRGLALFS